MENVKVRDGHYLCRMMYCKPEKISSDGLVTMKSGIVLKEAIAKKQDVIEYSSHPFLAEVVLAGVGCEGKKGDYLLVPNRLAGRLESLDMVIIDSKEYFTLSDSLCSVRMTKIDRKKYHYYG